MSEQTNAELIAEVTERLTWPTQTSDTPLLDRLAAALQATERRAVELAAVVKEVRDWASSAAYGEGDYYSGYDSAQAEVLDILDDGSTESLREHDRELRERIIASLVGVEVSLAASVSAFKAGWHHADMQGRVGERTAEGLRNVVRERIEQTHDCAEDDGRGKNCKACGIEREAH